MKPNQIDILASAVLCDLEQIDDAEESRRTRQLGRDVWKTDRFDGIHFDLTFFHSIAVADFDVGAGPDPHAAGDCAATNSVAQTFGENHFF